MFLNVVFLLSAASYEIMADLDRILTKEVKIFERIEHGENLAAVSLSMSAKPVRRPRRPIGAEARRRAPWRRRRPRRRGEIWSSTPPTAFFGPSQARPGSTASRPRPSIIARRRGLAFLFLSEPISSSFLTKICRRTHQTRSLRTNSRSSPWRPDVLDHIEHISHPAAEVEMLKCGCVPLNSMPVLVLSGGASNLLRRGTASRTTSAVAPLSVYARQPARRRRRSRRHRAVQCGTSNARHCVAGAAC